MITLLLVALALIIGGILLLLGGGLFAIGWLAKDIIIILAIIGLAWVGFKFIRGLIEGKSKE